MCVCVACQVIMHGMQITRGHPVFVRGQWLRPDEVCLLLRSERFHPLSACCVQLLPTKARFVETLYNFVSHVSLLTVAD